MDYRRAMMSAMVVEVETSSPGPELAFGGQDGGWVVYAVGRSNAASWGRMSGLGWISEQEDLLMRGRMMC